MTHTLHRLLIPCVAAVLAIAACEKQDKGGGAGAGASPKTPSKPALAEGERPSVAYVTNGIASFWTIAKAGALAGGKDFDAEVDVRMPGPGGAVEQKNIIEDLLVRGIDGI